MKLSKVLDKYYVMVLVGCEIVDFVIPDPPDTVIRVSFTVDDDQHEQYFNDQEIQLLDHPQGAFFVADVDGLACGFIALNGVDLTKEST